ncbi:M20 family metallopeptidase [Clostridium aestuarii]|uniref:M20 family metallopeptidase n=1 Tax=Clostridium aestuarii TaxID=338193 RepID=A0ABT4D1G9_9CLOT|nr:M20 family metallopeptidase [Clostridium aestuarii]MCY6485088.1 M20 family metallopeptidase [Clostridium aestuarii]
MDVRKLAKEYKQYVIELRRKFHMYPELSLKEFKTSQLIKEELDNIGITYISVAETGIIAEIKGKGKGKTIALRADIDGLAVTEANDLEYKSKHEGFMHACGHDCHIAMLLGAARILNEVKGELSGTVKIVFQPAEEIGVGAKEMIKQGALQGVDGVFGMHVWSDLECGKVCVKEGPGWAAADVFTIRVKGKGGHGSAPHQGIDAVLASSAIVMNLQSIVSRELSPFEPAVVSVGYLKAGSEYNVIASEAVLRGTTRCYNEEIRKKFPELIERIAKQTASTYRAEAELEYIQGPPVVVNDADCSKIADKAVQKIGAESVQFQKISAAEDVAQYMNKVPGVFAVVGVKNKDKGACYAQHHPNYNVDEEALEIGTALHVQYVFDFLNEK